MREVNIVVIGLGQSGQSVARYLDAKKIVFQMCDSRVAPPQLATFQDEFPHVSVHCGELDPKLLSQATQLIVSPGVSTHSPAIQAASQAGVEVIGDVELFMRECTKPIVAITGSNGKTTVTTLFSNMVQAAGLVVATGGNIGVPALELLSTDFDIGVLELSSFQCETTPSLHATVAVNLNVCEDHLDRYASYQDYIAAKLTIYQHAKIKVINLDDAAAWQNVEMTEPAYGFSLDTLSEHPISKSMQVITPKDLPLIDTEHYYDYQLANILAAWCLGKAINLSEQSMLQAIQQFSGLPHRCETVLSHQGVQWINDSKATNVGSALAAINSVGAKLKGHVILIAGGDGKGADFSPLGVCLQKYCKAVILLGKDKESLAAVVPAGVDIILVSNLSEAVNAGQQLAAVGDAVLLSPACASIDMFTNYIERGEQFAHHVKETIND